MSGIEAASGQIDMISTASQPRVDAGPGRARPRGRPSGSSRFAESDLIALDKIADRLLYEPDLPVATAARGLGFSSEAEIRRLQTKWRRSKSTLLAEAQRRHESPLDKLLHSLASVAALAEVLLRSAPIAAIQASLERASRRIAAEQRAGKGAKLSFDPNDRAAVDAAISRFESRQHHRADLAPDLPGDVSWAELPASQRLYAMALVLHELSLDEFERELKEASATLNPDRGLSK
jgi:hypothetical protein